MVNATVTVEPHPAEPQRNVPVWILDIAGEINAAAEPVLQAAYERATQAGAQVIVLNFEQLNYMNSTGIGLLVTLLIRVSHKHQTLRAYGLNEHYRQIFQLTRLDEAITLCASKEEAVG